jgi:hypothetical protein
MPLTAKGEEIMAAMKKQYGEKKGESVFYASKNAGTIEGVDTPEDATSLLDAAFPGIASAARAGKAAGEKIAAGGMDAPDFNTAQREKAESAGAVKSGDNMLSFGGGYPVSTPTGPGDKPMNKAASQSTMITDSGEYGRAASKFLGKNVMDVAKDVDLVEWAREEEKESEHKK